MRLPVRSGLSSLLLAGVLLGSAAAGSASAAPANDAFSNAPLLVGSNVTASVPLNGATLESGEHQPITGGSFTVWYRWVAPADGPVQGWACPMANGGAPYVTAFVGASVTSATSALSNGLDRMCLIGTSFNAVQGQQYRIQVSATSATSPPAQLRLQQRTTASPKLSWTLPTGLTRDTTSDSITALPLDIEGWPFHGFHSSATQCLVDGSTTHVTSCAEATVSFSGLTVGSHTVSMRSRDPWGLWSNWSTTSFTAVVPQPPTVQLTNAAGPSVPPVLAFSSDHPVFKWECSINGAVTWTTCASPLAWPFVTSGKPAAGTVLVRVTDTHLLVSPPASYTWGPPTAPHVSVVNTAPDDVAPVLTLSADQPVTGFECNGGAAWYACTSPVSWPYASGTARYPEAGRFHVRATGTNGLLSAVTTFIWGGPVGWKAPTGPTAPKPTTPTTPVAPPGLPPRLKLSGVKLSATTLTARKRATLSYALSRAAAVKLTVSRATKGRTAGGRCVKSASRNRKAKACQRFTPKVTLTLPGRAGRNAAKLGARTGRKSLAAGTYRLALTATATGAAPQTRTVGMTVRK